MNPIKIAKRSSCSLRDVFRRRKALNEMGVDLDYAIQNDLYRMTATQIRKYFSARIPRIYVQTIMKDQDATEYEIYRQMRRARKEFDIPYISFNRESLLNAEDGRLIEVRDRLAKKKGNAIKKIAKAADISEEEAACLAEDMKARYNVTPKFCYTHELYKLSEGEIEELLDTRRSKLSAKADVAMEEMGWDEEDLKRHQAYCSKRYRIGLDYYYSLKCYRLDDDQLAGILVHDDIHGLSSRLNNRVSRVDDKAQFMVNFREFLGRRSWANINTSFSEFEKFCKGLDRIFVKPVDGMHGQGARMVDIADADLASLYEELLSEKPLVAEEVIIQHPEMAKVNPSSVNTIRIYTIRTGDDVDIVNAYARFGNGGIVDNYSSGGLECGVDVDSGAINTPAVSKSGEVFDAHPITGVRFEGFQIPMWKEAVDTVRSAILSIDDMGLVGWDVAIGQEGVILVEGNSDPGPGAFQRFLVERGISMRDRFGKYLECLK